LSRNGRLNPSAEAGSHTTPSNIELYLAEIKERLNSVTIYGSIYKIRRLTQLVAPALDLAWLTDIENDLALVMEPRSKLDRLVQAEVLVEAGLALMTEADSVSKAPPLTRATWFRNGLMIAVLATCPIRLKNFFALELGRTFLSIKGTWWIVLPGAEVKEKRPDERPIPDFLTPWIVRYLKDPRPILARHAVATQALWLSSNDGNPLSYSAVESEVSRTTLSTLGVNISPNLFRTAAASTAAAHAAIINATRPRPRRRSAAAGAVGM